MLLAASNRAARVLPLGWAKFLWYRRKIDRVRVFALGVKPEWQHTGVAAKFYERHFDAAGQRAGIALERCFINIQRYGNMSSATVPVALVEALEAGRVAPGSNLLLTGFGAGLTWSAHVLRWGERTTPLGESAAELPPCPRSALEIVRGYMAVKHGSRYAR